MKRNIYLDSSICVGDFYLNHRKEKFEAYKDIRVTLNKMHNKLVVEHSKIQLSDHCTCRTIYSHSSRPISYNGLIATCADPHVKLFIFNSNTAVPAPDCAMCGLLVGPH